jgi:hypothetical protein
VDTLFPIETVLSPRLAWMANHSIKTHFSESKKHRPWTAWQGAFSDALKHGMYGLGADEDEAIVELAKRLQLPLWNEGGRA